MIMKVTTFSPKSFLKWDLATYIQAITFLARQNRLEAMILSDTGGLILHSTTNPIVFLITQICLGTKLADHGRLQHTSRQYHRPIYGVYATFRSDGRSASFFAATKLVLDSTRTWIMMCSTSDFMLSS